MKAFIVLAVALLAVASASRTGKPDYYWREFNGTAPHDALRVVQKGGKADFIGQGFFKDVGLLPGMLKQGVMEMSAVANGRVYSIKNNIKIMCTSSANPQKEFQWVSVHYQNLAALDNLHFLRLPIGGTETDTTVYIGRHSEPGFSNIGKIYTVEPYQGLTITNAQGKVTIYKNFQVLTMLNFDCEGYGEEYGEGYGEGYGNGNDSGNGWMNKNNKKPYGGLGGLFESHRRGSSEETN